MEVTTRRPKSCFSSETMLYTATGAERYVFRNANDRGFSHSNAQGAIRMYTPGYRPTKIAFLDGLRVYRNDATGIFVHRCHNIVIRNSLFADNYLGIDVDRTSGIEVWNTTIIGESDSYRELMKVQDVSPVCKQRKLKGIEIHTWKKTKAFTGLKVIDVRFSGFSNETACPSWSIHMDDNVSDN